MHAVLVGLNHKTAPIAIREKLHFENKMLPRALDELMHNRSLSGAVVISTCNRVEIYGATERIDESFDDMIAFLASFHGFERSSFESFLYKKHCNKAVEHLFEVVASLDSMILGEDQILSQVREAYFISKKNNAVNGLINKLFQIAIQTGKKVRYGTGISQGSVSVGSIAIEMVQDLLQQDHSKKMIFLIGAGKIAELTATNLRKHINCDIFLANRSAGKADELAERFNATVIPFEERYHFFAKSDIVVVSTGAPEYILTKNNIKQAGNDGKVLIDLSVPRNIDPSITDLGHQLYTIEDMEDTINENIRRRSKEVINAREIIDEISEEYFNWYAKQTIIPVMNDIKRDFDQMGKNLLVKHKNKLSALDQEQYEMVEDLLFQYSDKIIMTIMKNLKNITDIDDLNMISERLKHSFFIDQDS